MRTSETLTVRDIMNRSRQEAARRRIIKKRLGIITLIGILVIAFSAILFGNMTIVSAQEEADNNVTAVESMEFEAAVMVKGYTCIKINDGDTLWSIAEANIDEEHYTSIYTYIREVKELNGLTSDTIHSGSLLIIPIYVDSEFCQN